MGDVYKNIKEERVEAISVAIFTITFEIGLLIADERMGEKSIKQSIAQEGGNEAIVEL